MDEKISTRILLGVYMAERLLDCWIMNKSIWRAAIEVGFVVFLFYSNLLMGGSSAPGGDLKWGLFGLSGYLYDTKFRNCHRFRANRVCCLRVS
jgi:hypothetical protein